MTDQRQQQTGAVAPELIRTVARQLMAAKEHPPTIWSVLTTWPGTPLLLAYGCFGSLVLGGMYAYTGMPFVRDALIGLVMLVLGAALRDFAGARRAQRVWPAQATLIDWHQVAQAIDETKIVETSVGESAS